MRPISSPSASTPRLKDRSETGRRLADRLLVYQEARPLVLALPRGGVPVGYEIARRLGVPLDLLVVRKIGAPDSPEYALGALVEDGSLWIEEHRVREAGFTRSLLEPTIAREQEEVRRQVALFRSGSPSPEVRGRIVILADDGVATGATLRAAIWSARTRGALRVIVALGVAPPEALRVLEREANEVVVLRVPPNFFAVGEWYERFDPVPDDEVRFLLRSARRPAPSTDANGPPVAGDAPAKS